MVSAVNRYLRVPADVSGAVRIVESVGLSDFESESSEERQQAIADTVLVIEEGV